MSTFRRRLCIDFDGVLHSYTTPWAASTLIPDPPVPGAIEFLRAALERFDISVFSVRNEDVGGPEAMEAWLTLHGLTADEANRLEFPTHKPKAHIYLDDRGWQFNGTFPTLDEIEVFLPWNRR